MVYIVIDIRGGKSAKRLDKSVPYRVFVYFLDQSTLYPFSAHADLNGSPEGLLLPVVTDYI